MCSILPFPFTCVRRVGLADATWDVADGDMYLISVEVELKCSFNCVFSFFLV